MPKSVSLFTFHFSLFINTSIHYFKGSLSAQFRFALLLIFASASVFSSSPCTPDRAITTCDMGWTFLSPDSTGFVTGVLVEGGWEQPALLVPCESWKNNKWELLCAKRFHYLHNDSGSTFITGSILMPGSIFINRQDLQGNTLPLQTSQISILPFYR